MLLRAARWKTWFAANPWLNVIGSIRVSVLPLPTTELPAAVMEHWLLLTLGNKVIHPFGDFLLHDIGTGDGIVQAGPQDTANKLRTAPLWGLRTKSRVMHDLASLTLEDAIRRHRGEARHVTAGFRSLTAAQQQQLIVFLKSL